MKAALSIVFVGALTAGCAVDALFLGELTRGDQQEVPGAGNNFLEGQATAMAPGSTVRFVNASGNELTDLSTATGPTGAFAATLSATSEFVNLLVEVDEGARAAWGILPRVERKESVQDPDRTFVFGESVPAMADIGMESTFYTLILLGQAQYGDPAVALSSIAPEDVIASVGELEQRLEAEDARLLPLWEMLERLWADGATVAPPFVAFPEPGESHLAVDAVTPGLDLDGDGVGDGGTEAFDAALAEAVGALGFDVCVPTDKIRFVLMVDFNDGNLDRNCSPIDRWKWTEDEPGRQMFLTGGIHETTPACETEDPPCLEASVVDAFSEEMGNWTPNVAPMFDDGTNGDLVAGDGIWSRSFDAPWFEVPEGVRGVRVHYKFTWANPGQLWTSTEEWPGNSRILELRDLNGDGIVTRYDQYGDETTNKDKANLLAPGKGGCGSLTWPDEEPLKDTCVNDTNENMIDTDGDCVLDTWPTPGAATPLTEKCGGDAN